MISFENTLSGRREILFLYDIKMGNPNGDPDENRPRILPDGNYYVNDVRLKRFVRDFLKSQNNDILVDNIEGRTTNLTGRVSHYLKQKNQAKAEGPELVKILQNAFIDARMFGSSFAFKEEKLKDDKGQQLKDSKEKELTWKPNPEPKTITGPVQFNMGEVLHKAESVDIHGTSILSSDESKDAGTFTTYYCLRYALIGFSGVANQHSAKVSGMTDQDYETMLKSLWHGVRSAGNTRTKVGQIPHLLVSVEYNPKEEFQFGRLHDYVKLKATKEKEEKEWASPEDYELNLETLITRLNGIGDKIAQIRYAKSPDIKIKPGLPSEWKRINNIENLSEGDT